MLIFVIIREQWTDDLFFELRVREAKRHPFSYYKDSIKQVVPILQWGEPPAKNRVRVTSQNES